MGFRVTHLYGLTESYGPATLCAWQAEWSELPLDRARAADGAAGRADADARASCRSPIPRHGGAGAARRRDARRGHAARQHDHEGLPRERRGDRARRSRGGWYHTGDLAVWHPDGYIEIKDRSKDIIISGGENISSLEVEECLYRHPQRDGGGGGRAARRASGARRRARSSTLKPGAARRRRGRSSPGAASASRTSRCRSTSCSGRCRRPRPARSRSSCCASARATLARNVMRSSLMDFALPSDVEDFAPRYRLRARAHAAARGRPRELRRAREHRARRARAHAREAKAAGLWAPQMPTRAGRAGLSVVGARRVLRGDERRRSSARCASTARRPTTAT